MTALLHAQIQTLRKYQAWRTGEDTRTMDEAGIVPAAVTSALDAVLEIADSYLRDISQGEIMKPALERADLAFIYDELRQSGKDRAALLAKCGHQGYTAADMASAAADGFRKGQEATSRQAAPQKPKQEQP